MALLGSIIPSEVGLRLLLCPFGSNVVIRTACCTVGVVLPVYSTFKAIETKDQNERQKWLLYWAAYGSFSLVEVFTDKIVSWVPLYYHMKFAFLVWLQLPSTDGARHLYMNHLRPFLLRHQARVDHMVDLAYGEIVKFVITHHAEIEFARTLLMKFLAVVNKMRTDVDTMRPESDGMDVGPRRQIEGPHSDHDD
ncbi:PREDICTED: HVA22-like protein k isoform X2 [Nelumbo nucifera]|uniref:HVA22-like protein n=1 Tax=Nelumbo nucifera TaxID=4432 RepID=A0A1U7YV62_NELNU|nr:PREDICTED: HVA22-like protein k isoform X2 [Nelumbo nucifera]